MDHFGAWHCSGADVGIQEDGRAALPARTGSSRLALGTINLRRAAVRRHSPASRA
jgi:hypothetical protein